MSEYCSGPIESVYLNPGIAWHCGTCSFQAKAVGFVTPGIILDFAQHEWVEPAPQFSELETLLSLGMYERKLWHGRGMTSAEMDANNNATAQYLAQKLEEAGFSKHGIPVDNVQVDPNEPLTPQQYADAETAHERFQAKVAALPEKTLREKRAEVIATFDDKTSGMSLTEALDCFERADREHFDSKHIEKALLPLCDVLDPEEGPVIIAWGVKQLAARLAENLFGGDA